MMKKKCFFFLTIIPLLIMILYYKFVKKKSNIINFINAKIHPKSIVIFEINPHHYECLPGYTKYFTDLGYHVDIIMRKNKRESMERFEPKNKIRMFEYNNIKEIKYNLEKYKKKILLYNYSLLHTTDIKPIFKELGYYDNPNSLFIIHAIDYLNELKLDDFIKKKHAFGLADYGVLIYANPNYFGNFNLSHNKNNKSKTSFFITSSINRNYSQLIDGLNYIKEKNIDFELNVIGHENTFNPEMVPKNLLKYCHFYLHVKYQKMYEIVQKSDFIIINLFPDNEENNLFRTTRATGSIQLSYGFYKPVIIEENFAPIYKLTNETSITFQLHDMRKALEKAATMTNEDYIKMSKNMKILKDTIYNTSLNNIKKVL